MPSLKIFLILRGCSGLHQFSVSLYKIFYYLYVYILDQWVTDQKPHLPTSNFFQHSFICVCPYHTSYFHTLWTENTKKPILTNISFIGKVNDTYAYRGSLWSPNMMGSGEYVILQRISIPVCITVTKAKISMSPK